MCTRSALKRNFVVQDAKQCQDIPSRKKLPVKQLRGRRLPETSHAKQHTSMALERGFFFSRALVSLSLSVTGKKRREG